MILQHTYNRITHDPETFKKPTRVERVGIISTKTRVESLINAGKKLSAIRDEMYDFKGDEIDLSASPDITRKPGVDVTEIQAQMRVIKERILSQKKAYVEMKKLEAEKKHDEKTGIESDASVPGE